MEEPRILEMSDFLKIKFADGCQGIHAKRRDLF